MTNLPWGDAIDAGEGHPAEDAFGTEFLCENLFVAQPVLESEDRRIVLDDGFKEVGEKVIGRGLEGDDDEVGFGDRRRVIVGADVMRGEGEISVAAFDLHAGISDV